MLKIDFYYYVYSAMVQATGSLIALVGVFIIFRLQIQRDMIRDAEDNLLSGKGLGGTRKDLERKAEEYLSNNEATKTNSLYIFIKENLQNLQLHKEIRKYAMDRGVLAIISVTSLFIYYIIILHNHHSYIVFPLLPFMVGMVVSILFVGFLLNYIIRCIVTREK